MRKLLILLLICILANQVLTRSLKHKSRRHQQDEGNATGEGEPQDGGNGDGGNGEGSDQGQGGNGTEDGGYGRSGDSSEGGRGDGSEGGHEDPVDACIEHECENDIKKCFGEEDCLQIFERCAWLQYTHVHDLEEGRKCVHEHPDAENLFHCITHDCLGIQDPEVLVRFTQRHH